MGFFCSWVYNMVTTICFRRCCSKGVWSSLYCQRAASHSVTADRGPYKRRRSHWYYRQTGARLAVLYQYSKIWLKRPLSKGPKIGFLDWLSLNAGQKYCRMLQGEHSAILLTFIKLPFVFKIIVLSIFEWSLKTGFTVVWYKMWSTSEERLA